MRLLAAPQSELIRAYEADYARQYSDIWETFGPWDDGVADVDPGERRVVGDMLATLSNVFVAREAGIIDEVHASYVQDLFVDWLRLDRPRRIWNDVFAPQVNTWPNGFVTWIADAVEQGASCSAVE